MRSPIALALALVACTGSDRSDVPVSRTASPSTARGPDALVLRVPRTGGIARVTAYPNVDSTVWTASNAAPGLDHILAFDADAGLIAAVDVVTRPVWIDLHVGTSTIASREKFHGVTSVDGSTIYGVAPNGSVARFTPSGNWVFTPPQPARAVFPQSNGTILVLGGRGETSRLWRVRPPETRIADSVMLPSVISGVGAPLGDRVFFIRPPLEVIGVRARTLGVGAPIKLDHAVQSIAITPSGDRAYVVVDSTNAVFIVDPYQDRVMARAELPGRARDLRVDPFGRFVLVRAATGDSVWVVSIGTARVVETVRSQWRGDIPFVAIDGAVALTDGRDVILHRPGGDTRVAGGAADFWYPFVWNGLRARDPALDQIPAAPGDSDSTKKVLPPAPAPPETTAHPTAPVDSAKLGFTVSFAALLDEARAREQASRIAVNGQSARVVTSMTAGTAVYRVVLGPYPTRDEAERAGRGSGQAYQVYAGTP